MQRLVSVTLLLLLFLGMTVLINAPKDDLLTLSVANTTLHVEVAETPAEREKGLSGRQALGQSDGMLFLFETDGLHGFWMPDMYLSLDIIWLNADKTVVHIEHNVSPDSYPAIFTSTEPARFVLELAAGESEHLGITNGSRFSWSD
ncbi:MAG: DUF192 domain-containing protein [Candidatus Kaiserbacteria bacterium]|nr:DUF192 domain-containing protein [Candidatus Kaiserbacteria bacterium]